MRKRLPEPAAASTRNFLRSEGLEPPTSRFVVWHSNPAELRAHTRKVQATVREFPTAAIGRPRAVIRAVSAGRPAKRLRRLPTGDSMLKKLEAPFGVALCFTGVIAQATWSPLFADKLRSNNRKGHNAVIAQGWALERALARV